MTDDEMIKFYKELEKWYGDKLVNPDHYPIQFRNQVKLYRYYMEQKNERSESN